MCKGWLGERIEDAKESGERLVDNTVNAVKNVGSAFDDSVLKTIKDAGSSIEDEFDRALADPVLGPIITVVAQVYGGPAAVAALKYKQTGELSDALEAGAKSYIIQNVVSAANSFNPAADAVGGVTGPDNIDVGGGFNPADGATAEQLADARNALDAPVVPSNPIYDITEPPITGPELTSQEVTDMIAKDQASSMSAQEIQAMIDEEAAASAAAAATPTQVAAAKALGMSTLDYIRAGLLANSLIGDPLNLGGEQPSGGGGGSTGFAQVPIPSEWKSPTYAAPSAPIDLNSIFTDQNLLAGTQWQGLQSQQPNISFNDIFAAGQQQTPMGTPVDINQIVSAILGQAATSQKSA